MTAYRDFEPTVRFRDTLAISTDGGRVAWVDDVQGQFNVAVLSLSGGRAQHMTSYDDSSVRKVCWHPDGRSLLFMADSRGDESWQLLLVDGDGGQPRALTDSPGARYWAALGDSFSPDGHWLAYAGNDRSLADQDVLIRNLRSGEVRRVYAGGGRVYAGYWSPDGRRLTMVDWRGATTDQVMYLLEVDSGQVTRLTPEDASVTWLPGPWLADGSGIVVRSDLDREFVGLGVLDPTTEVLSWLDTPDWDVEEVAASRDGRMLAWLVNVDGASQLRIRDLCAGKDLQAPDLPAGHASALTVSPDGRRAAMLLSSPTSPWNVVVADLDAGGLRWLTNHRPTSEGRVTYVEPVAVRYPGRDGRQIPAYLYRPASTAEPVGVVLAIHGGPPAQERPAYSNDGLFQYLASRGVAVFAPNVRGSSGYGLSHERAVDRDWGGVDLEDWADAARYLHSQTWVDPARIGLYGRSYGAFGVLSCVSRLPQFDWAAAVAWAGISNLVTLAKAMPPTWNTQVSTMIGDPDKDADFLMSRSPVTHADRIRTPLFLIQGANDVRVPRQESDQIVKRLRDRGIEVRYDVYPDEGHIFGRRDNQTKARADAGEFLLAHLTRR